MISANIKSYAVAKIGRVFRFVYRMNKNEFAILFETHDGWTLLESLTSIEHYDILDYK